MADVDKQNGKKTGVLGGHVLKRYHQSNLNYLGIQTKSAIQGDWTLYYFIRRTNTFVITHIICTPNCG